MWSLQEAVWQAKESEGTPGCRSISEVADSMLGQDGGRLGLLGIHCLISYLNSSAKCK